MGGIKKWILKAKKVSLGTLAITVIVMAFAFATVMSPVSAETVQATQIITSEYGPKFVVNYDTISIWLGGNMASTIAGQVIQFHNATGGPSGKVTLSGISGDADGDEKSSDSAGLLETSLKTGKYVTEAPGCVGCRVTNISVSSADLELKLKKGTKTVSSIPRGTGITVKFTGLDPKEHDGVSLEVTDPDGYPLTWNSADGKIFDKVNVSYLSDMVIDTTTWKLGTYEFKVVTEEEYARGLDEESDTVTLEIQSSELKIEAERTEITELMEIKLTVTGMSDHNIQVWIEKGAEHARFPGGSSDNPGAVSGGTFEDTIDADGKMEYVVYFDKIGTYVVKVKDSAAEDSVDISVSKKKVTYYMPETCAIGADLVVNGTANTGNTVDIAIENVIVETGIEIEKGKFEVKLPTPATSETGTEGGIKIKAFIDANFSSGQDVSGIADDGSVMVLMITGDLTAESSATLVSPGDSFTLSGTALGSKVVDVLIVAPKGGGGNGLNPTNSEDNGLPRGIVYEAASVSSDFKWYVDIDVNEDADTGTHLVFVLSPGKNGVYEGIRDDDLLNGTKTKYFGGDLSKLAGKTQEQINATLWDATIGTAGSDDFMEKFTIKIGTAEVQLYSIVDVVIGDELVIMGTSNREGHSIIVKVEGPVNLGTKFATVENGKFKTNFSTSEALTGNYTVEADDGEGHTDTTTVSIIMPVRTLTSPTPAPTAIPMPTMSQKLPAPESTSAPAAQLENSSTSTSSAVPGFEAVFVITALAAVYLLVTRKKRK